MLKYGKRNLINSANIDIPANNESSTEMDNTNKKENIRSFSSSYTSMMKQNSADLLENTKLMRSSSELPPRNNGMLPISTHPGSSNMSSGIGLIPGSGLGSGSGSGVDITVTNSANANDASLKKDMLLDRPSLSAQHQQLSATSSAFLHPSNSASPHLLSTSNSYSTTLREQTHGEQGQTGQILQQDHSSVQGQKNQNDVLGETTTKNGSAVVPEVVLLPPLPDENVPIQQPHTAATLADSYVSAENNMDLGTDGYNNYEDEHYGTVIINDYYSPESNQYGNKGSADNFNGEEYQNNQGSGANVRQSFLTDLESILTTSASLSSETNRDLENQSKNVAQQHERQKRNSQIHTSLSPSHSSNYVSSLTQQQQQQPMLTYYGTNSELLSQMSPSMSPRISLSKRFSNPVNITSPEQIQGMANPNGTVQRTLSMRSNLSHSLVNNGTPLNHNGDIQSSITRSSSVNKKYSQLQNTATTSSNNNNGFGFSNQSRAASHSSLHNTTIDIPSDLDLFDDHSIIIERHQSLSQLEETQTAVSKPRNGLIKRASSALLRKASGFAHSNNAPISPHAPYSHFNQSNSFVMDIHGSQSPDNSMLYSSTPPPPRSSMKFDPSAPTPLPLLSSPLAEAQDQKRQMLKKQKSFSNKLRTRFNRILSTSVGNEGNQFPTTPIMAETDFYENFPSLGSTVSDSTTLPSSNTTSGKLTQPVHVSRKSSVSTDTLGTSKRTVSLKKSIGLFKRSTSNLPNISTSNIADNRESQLNDFERVEHSGNSYESEPQKDYFLSSTDRTRSSSNASGRLNALNILKRSTSTNSRNKISNTAHRPELSKEGSENDNKMVDNSLPSSNQTNKLLELEKSLVHRVSSLNISTLKRSSSLKSQSKDFSKNKIPGRSVSLMNIPLSNARKNMTRAKSGLGKSSAKRNISTEHKSLGQMSQIRDLSYTLPDPQGDLPWDESIISSIEVDIKDLLEETPSIIISGFNKIDSYGESEYAMDGTHGGHGEKKLNYNNKYLERDINIGLESKLSFDKFYQRVLTNQIVLPRESTESRASNSARASVSHVGNVSGSKSDTPVDMQLSTSGATDIIEPALQKHILNSEIVRNNDPSFDLNTTTFEKLPVGSSHESLKVDTSLLVKEQSDHPTPNSSGTPTDFTHINGAGESTDKSNPFVKKMSLKEYIAILSDLQRVEDSKFNTLEKNFKKGGWVSNKELLELKQKRMLVNKRWAERISFYQNKL